MCVRAFFFLLLFQRPQKLQNTIEAKRVKKEKKRKQDRLRFVSDKKYLNMRNEI